ncbi:MAG: alanine racemase [Gemmatimonadaceae bacterium]
MRRAWIDIDLDALRRNAQTLAKNSGVPLLPMIKADAYGLGAVAAARTLRRVGVWGYGVATVAEGEALRSAGIDQRILIFSPLLVDEFDDVRRLRLTPTLGDPRAIRAWTAGDGEWHLSIDTGMSRAGIPWFRIADVLEAARERRPEGAFTHFHSAECNDGTVATQEARFREALAALGTRPQLVHAENSPSMERRSPSPWDLARPGVFLYGVGGAEGALVQPEPVAHFRARIVELREVRAGETVSYGASWTAQRNAIVATVSAGYADGYRRALSNRGTALVNGRRVSVVGKVTMDMTMLDVSDVGCVVGDVATLLGRDGDELLDLQDVARTAEMSPYELLVGLKLRVPRHYTGENGGATA